MWGTLVTERCKATNKAFFSQFEELVEQFIPSDPTWKGWVKMALHQPFFEVIPVARELISKTKRIASKGVQQSTSTIAPRRPKPMKTSERPLPKVKDDTNRSTILASPYTDEPEVMATGERSKTPPHVARINGSGSPPHGHTLDRDRARVTSMFRRSTISHSRRTSGGGDNVSAFPWCSLRYSYLEQSIASLISSAHNIANNTSRTIRSHPDNTAA